MSNKKEISPVWNTSSIIVYILVSPMSDFRTVLLWSIIGLTNKRMVHILTSNQKYTLKDMAKKQQIITTGPTVRITRFIRPEKKHLFQSQEKYVKQN